MSTGSGRFGGREGRKSPIPMNDHERLVVGRHELEPIYLIQRV
jgi:hypothetical protein